MYDHMVVIEHLVKMFGKKAVEKAWQKDYTLFGQLDMRYN